jgi:hypothetical protein
MHAAEDGHETCTSLLLASHGSHLAPLAPPTGPLSSTVSQVHAGCKQKSSSVGAVDQTAVGANEQSESPRAECS